MLTCNACAMELTQSNWYPALQRKRHCICKTCNLARTAKWRADNRDKARAISARSRQSLRDSNPTYSRDWSRKERALRRIEMLAAYGGKCCGCGIDNPLVLDIDHIYDDGAADRKAGIHGWQLYRKLRREGYPRDRYQLLCRNCNWLKEMRRRGVAEVIGRAIVNA